jgi:hypothetical protein
MGKKNRKKDRKPSPPSSVDVRDRLTLACDVVQTVVDALAEEYNSQPAAMTLLHYGYEPLAQLRDELEEDAEEEREDDE